MTTKEAEDYIPNGRLRLLIQVSGFVFLAGVAWWRISVLETAVQKQSVQIEAMQATMAQTSITVTRLETILDLLMREKADVRSPRRP